MRKRTVGNGEGSLYHDKKTNKWIFQYYVGTKRKTVKQKIKESKKDFNIRVVGIKSELNNGTYIEKDNKTFRELAEEHIKNKSDTNSVSANTYRRDIQTLKQLEKICSSIMDIPIQKITTSHLRKVLPNMKIYSNSVINKMYRLMNKIFKIALSDRLIIFNPMDNENINKPKSIKEDKPVEALTVEEQKRLLNILEQKEHKYNDIILLQLYTGMRIGEVLALTTKDIDYERKVISVNKTLSRNEKDKVILGKTTKTENSKREILIDSRIEKVLNRIQKNQIVNIKGFLFYNNINDTFINPQAVNSYLNRLNNKYKIAPKLHTHMLRHTLATRMGESGVNPKVAQAILGHKNIEMTLNIYTSVDKKFEEQETEKYNRYMLEKCL